FLGQPTLLQRASCALGVGVALANFHTEMPVLFRAMLCCTGRRSQHFRLRHTPSFPRVHNGIRSRARCKKDSKMILALSDSFRKLLSLQVLASSMALNCPVAQTKPP